MESTSFAWSRVFAAIYEPSLRSGERAGMNGHRAKLLSGARGFTVEIGGGTGMNLPHYPEDLDELVVIDAPAERLPFADGSVDTVVSTLVLCTVESPDLALREITRVLREDGQLLFIEHVRSDSPALAGWQDRLAGPWGRFACGCHCNRATVGLIRACRLGLEAVSEAPWEAMPPIVWPLVIGRAGLLPPRPPARG